MPVVIARPALRIVIDPQVALLGRAMAWFEIFDGRFVHLEFGRLKHFGFDRFADRGGPSARQLRLTVR